MLSVSKLFKTFLVQMKSLHSKTDLIPNITLPAWMQVLMFGLEP